MYQYIAHSQEFLLLEVLNLYLILPNVIFAFLSAEHVSDLFPNQDHRSHY